MDVEQTQQVDDGSTKRVCVCVAEEERNANISEDGSFLLSFEEFITSACRFTFVFMGMVWTKSWCGRSGQKLR